MPKNIAQVIEKAKKFADEIVVYDDGSSDQTRNIVKASGATVIRNPINRGYGVR